MVRLSTRHRSPANHSSYDSHSHSTPHQNDSIYYTAMDFDSEYSDSTRPLTTPTEHSRNYIDPWDLENYVYVTSRNMETSLERTTATPSPAGAPISSTFYYIPGTDEFRGTYAGLDEKSFYNQRVHPDDYMENMDYSTYTDIESSSGTGDRTSSCGSTVSTLQLHTPGFGVASGRRPLVLPKPAPQLEFPPPPPIYDYYELPPEHNYCSLNDCYDCNINNGNIPLYDTTLRRRKKSSNVIYTPNHFGLNKKGLLQIDYSCNWNNLDRYIAK